MIRTGLFALSLTALTGCGGKPPIATGEVEGIVTCDGKPLAEVSVVFRPDNTKSNFGPAAGAMTDQNGHYRLVYSIPNDHDPSAPTTGEGAPVGWHLVTVMDYKMMNELLPPPGRVPAIYTNAATTPLAFEVQSGAQTINLELNK
jgi:hypothetical protein